MSPKLLAGFFTNGEFSYKKCLVWTGIAIVVVLALVFIGHCLLKRSERNSEKFRLTKQVNMLREHAMNMIKI